jgi:hypothetical protein
MSSRRTSAVLITIAGLCALSATLAAAQTAKDALICSEPDHSEPALITWFANTGWDRNNNPAAATDFRAAHMFVGNLDGDQPRIDHMVRQYGLGSEQQPGGSHGFSGGAHVCR